MVVIIAVVALIKTFIVQNFSIPSASMERTLMTGDRIIVSVWDREDVKRGAWWFLKTPTIGCLSCSAAALKAQP